MLKYQARIYGVCHPLCAQAVLPSLFFYDNPNLKTKSAEIKKETQDKAHNKSEHEIWVGQKSGNTNGVSLSAATADDVTIFFAENVKESVSKVFVP